VIEAGQRRCKTIAILTVKQRAAEKRIWHLRDNYLKGKSFDIN